MARVLIRGGRILDPASDRDEPGDLLAVDGRIEAVGADRFFWASDFPHPDHPPEYVPNLEKLVGGLAEASRAGVLGANVRRAYGLGG